MIRWHDELRPLYDELWRAIRAGTKRIEETEDSAEVAALIDAIANASRVLLELGGSGVTPPRREVE